MHAGKSGESTPAATKGRRRLGHRLTLWSVPDNVITSTFTIMTTPSAPLRRLRAFFLLAQPPLLFQEGNTLVLTIHSHLHMSAGFVGGHRPPLQFRLDPLLKRSTPHNTHNKRRKPVVLPGRFPDDRAHGRHVIMTQSPAESKDQQFLGYGSDKQFRISQQCIPQRYHAVHAGAVDELAGCVDRSAQTGDRAAVARAPRADRVEVLHR